MKNLDNDLKNIETLDELDLEYSKKMNAYLKSSPESLNFLCDYFEARAALNNSVINSKNPERSDDLAEIKLMIAQNKVYTDFINDIRGIQYNINIENEAF